MTYKAGISGYVNFMLWYTNWRSKHESSALTEEYVRMGMGGVG